MLLRLGPLCPAIQAGVLLLKSNIALHLWKDCFYNPDLLLEMVLG